MSPAVIRGIAAMNLRNGQAVRFDVEGQIVELRVVGPTQPAPSPVVPESNSPSPEELQNVMIEAWTDLSGPIRGVPCEVRVGQLPPLDPPIIPSDDEE